MKFDSIQSIFTLDNKTAIVTGAGGYFGKTFSESLLLAGAKVVLLGRGVKIRNTAEFFKEKYGEKKVDFCEVDFYDEIAYKNALIEISDNNPTIDILINNAFEFSKETGFNDPSGKMENISKQQWMKSLEAGVYWYALSTQVIGEKMKKQLSGSIINISSMYAVVAPDPNLYKGVEVFNPPSYGAAKAAVIAFSKYTASFFGEYNIRCNSIVAGSFPNLDTNSYNSPKDMGFVNRLIEKTVLRRTGKLDDLVGTVVFLASDASSYMTGQTLVIDGGWTIR